MKLNGIELYYEVHGEGPPLVLAHGYTASLRMWDAQVPALSEKYRVVTYDTRGHGTTSAPADMEAYSLARDYVADQAALMDHLGIERAHVGGLSMGGMIAQEFASQHRARVRSLLLFDTGPGMPGVMRDPSVRERFDQVREAVRKTAGARYGRDRRSDARRPHGQHGARRCTAAGGRARAPRGHGEHEDRWLPGRREGDAGLARHARPPAHRWRAVARAGWRARSAAGGQPRDAPGHRWQPFVLLRDCWHGSCVWRPDAFLRAATEFLDDVEAGTPVSGEYVM